jgi:hypothetical protein
MGLVRDQTKTPSLHTTLPKYNHFSLALRDLFFFFRFFSSLLFWIEIDHQTVSGTCPKVPMTDLQIQYKVQE